MQDLACGETKGEGGNTLGRAQVSASARTNVPGIQASEQTEVPGASGLTGPGMVLRSSGGPDTEPSGQVTRRGNEPSPVERGFFERSGPGDPMGPEPRSLSPADVTRSLALLQASRGPTSASRSTAPPLAPRPGPVAGTPADLRSEGVGPSVA